MCQASKKVYSNGIWGKHQRGPNAATEVNEIEILGEVVVNPQQSVRNLEKVTGISKSSI